ncbi:MAG: hypothetical protein CL878_05960 [Dehalococcoidia bacterium]|nr:hypothetical protein [Dehalococcoidia bacterium]
MEILPGIHELPETLAPVFPDPRVWTSMYLLVGDHCALVDSGVPRSADRLILPYLAEVGIAADQLGIVVNTHGHNDHVGSNVRLREACGAQIVLHEADAHWLDEGHMFGEDLVPVHQPDRTLKTGELIELGAATYEVLSLAGHTSGSLGLWDPNARVLFCGDALQGDGSTSAGLAFYLDPDAYLASVEQALLLPIEHLCTAHPYLPATASHIHGAAKVRAFLECSRDFALTFGGEIVDTLQAAGQPQTATKIATAACARRGLPTSNFMADRVTTAHLERLEAQGVVRRVEAEPRPVWQLV